MILGVLLLYCLSTANAEDWWVRGRVFCNYKNPYEVRGTVQLWEKDRVTRDDFQDQGPIAAGSFPGLHFHKTELFGVEPYLKVIHDCHPDIINGRTDCMAVSYDHFRSPAPNPVYERMVDINRGELVCGAAVGGLTSVGK
ncbi:unnamed protein product [Bursaphelenchus xylophilus]|uniref:(pine wood nematode) hypothetical protein n=1 Tax=Bursaphelenchus xylophilus TaxID=6326 RepID=A0A1I7RXI3_BURXY|nr:unnamed protein product [Bursaphelenchus xylophilus]CAG9126450.1 unnamed protein product [Bursaphelenchus xylophilus]